MRRWGDPATRVRPGPAPCGPMSRHATNAAHAARVAPTARRRCRPRPRSGGGCLLLFQSGGKSDRPEVLQAAMTNGWRCVHALTWTKSTEAPTNGTSPYMATSERILVFTRNGDRLHTYEHGLSRSDILTYSAITKSATVKMDAGVWDYNSVHMFQKPSALCDFLVRKHTRPGDLVVEPFGCSGSGCVSAAELNRNWIYIESNDRNFRWGQERLERAVANQAVG